MGNLTKTCLAQRRLILDQNQAFNRGWTTMRLASIAMLSFGLLPICAANAEVVNTDAGPMQLTAVAEGFDEPWAIGFLPDGGILVTERAGALWLIRESQRTAVTGLPEVFAQGQGGLLDVMVPRDFATSREIWLSYARPARRGGATALGRGILSEDGARIDCLKTVFTAEGYTGGRHFGSRIVEAMDGTIYLTTGDRGTGPKGMQAQNPALAAGKVIHLNRDGSPASRIEGWMAGVHSLGHRNIQGAALDRDGSLLTVEHGAKGGDELNRIAQGRNYGWPVISYGVNYNGRKIGEGQAKPGLEQPLHYWDPSIAPSGLMVYSGALVRDWAGDIFTGSLNSDFISRLDPDRPTGTGFAEERIASDATARVRDIVEGPDGAIWFLSVNEGTLFRMAP